MKKVSVIIPAFNEEEVIEKCLKTLIDQSYKELEIIVIDDGSTDKTMEVLLNLKSEISSLKILEQKHLGPGLARNLGANKASGDILVFVDADMTFDKNFIGKLIEPIINGKTIGTFSKEEFVSNKDNIWSKCWNINKGLPVNKMHHENYPNEQKVFRAILKKEFEKSGGFRPIGYVDDYTISESLGILAKAAPGAIFYHQNPGNLTEIYKQARWIGKSEYKNRKIKNEQIMRIFSIIRYSLPCSLLKGVLESVKNGLPQYLIFKVVYDLAIEISLIGSFFGEQSYK